MGLSPPSSHGGGISVWGQESTSRYVGSGDPTGVVTPGAIGDLYVDDTTPALYQATGTTSADWQQVGGGGSSPVLFLKLPFTFATANLDTGVPIPGWTPKAGDVLYDCWIEVDEFFNGTTPKGDLMFNGATPPGFFGAVNVPRDMANGDGEYNTGINLLSNTSDTNNSLQQTSAADGFARIVPGPVIADCASFDLVISQDGTPSGGPTGATQGSGIAYAIVYPAAP